MLNVIQASYVDEILVEKETAEARKKARAELDSLLGTPVRAPGAVTAKATMGRAPEDMPDVVTSGTPSRPDLPVKPYIPPTPQTGDGASPFPGLAPPLA